MPPNTTLKGVTNIGDMSTSEIISDNLITYFDWAFISTLLIVVITGFVTEILHYVRLEPHRHLAYFVHLVFVCALFLYLPYSKFAHIIYRTVAMIYAEYSGRNGGVPPIAAGKKE